MTSVTAMSDFIIDASDRQYAELGLSDGEFRRMLRSVNDTDVVTIGHLKDIIAWLRAEGQRGRGLDSRGCILFAESLMEWLAHEVRITPGSVVN